MGREAWQAERMARAVAAEAADPTEAQMLRALTEAARAGGWLYHHTQRSDYGRQMGLRGFPDLLLVHPVTGKIIALEVKARRGIVTPEQKDWLEALAARCVTAVVWPTDLDRWVQRLNAGRPGDTPEAQRLRLEEGNVQD